MERSVTSLSIASTFWVGCWDGHVWELIAYRFWQFGLNLIFHILEGVGCHWVFFGFSVGKYFHWSACKFTNTLFHLIIFEKIFTLHCLYATLLFKFFQYICIPIISKIAESSREYHDSSITKWKDHFFKNLFIFKCSVYELSSYNKIVFLSVLEGERFQKIVLTKQKFIKLLIYIFTICLF